MKAPLWLKIASASGLIVSIIAGIYSMFPIKAVDQPLAFALKVLAFVLIANVIGVVLYAVRGKRSSKAAAASVSLEPRDSPITTQPADWEVTLVFALPL